MQNSGLRLSDTVCTVPLGPKICKIVAYFLSVSFSHSFTFYSPTFLCFSHLQVCPEQFWYLDSRHPLLPLFLTSQHLLPHVGKGLGVALSGEEPVPKFGQHSVSVVFGGLLPPKLDADLVISSGSGDTVTHRLKLPKLNSLKVSCGLENPSLWLS